MPQLKAAQELLFTSNDDPPEKGVKSTKFSVNLVNVSGVIKVSQQL